MSHDPELIERAARAIYSAWREGAGPPTATSGWDHVHERVKEDYRKQARAALAELKEGDR
jgi:hypothetical protein